MFKLLLELLLDVGRFFNGGANIRTVEQAHLDMVADMRKFALGAKQRGVRETVNLEILNLTGEAFRREHAFWLADDMLSDQRQVD